MAVIDDLKKLAAEDVVYLTRQILGASAGEANTPEAPSTFPREVWRGRLHQALSGNWVFNAHTGQNGVVGFVLGAVDPYWGSSESPAEGIAVTITTNLVPLALIAGEPTGSLFLHTIVLRSVIPADFAD